MTKKKKWNLKEHLNWLEKQPPSIIGQTCQMLSALKIPMNPKEGFIYLVRKRMEGQTFKIQLGLEHKRGIKLEPWGSGIVNSEHRISIRDVVDMERARLLEI